MLPTSNASSSSVSERKSLSSLFERHGLTRGPRRLAQDLHKEDHNEGKTVKWMLNNFDFVSKSGARANGPYRTVTLYILESHGPRKKPMEKPVLPALCNMRCTSPCVASAIQISSRKMIALTMVTFGKITHVWLWKKCIRYYVSWMLLPAYTVFVCVCAWMSAPCWPLLLSHWW